MALLKWTLCGDLPPAILWEKMLIEVFGTYDTIDMITYDFGTIPCGELREEERGCPMVEFLEEMGTKPPSSDYQAHRKYSIGSTGGVSAEEVEERGGSYGYRVGEGRMAERRDGERMVGRPLLVTFPM